MKGVFVINKLKKIIPITIALIFLMSTVAFASTDIVKNANRGDLLKERTQHSERIKSEKNKNENRGDFLKERTKASERVKFEGERSGLKTNASEEVMEKCNELKEKLNNGVITKEQFCEEMNEINPERMKSNQDRWQNKKKNVPEELKENVDELRAMVKNSEITSEQFREEIKQLRQQ